MASNYAAFRLIYNDEFGRTQAFAGVTVKVRTSANNYASDVATLTSDGNGNIIAGTLSVPAGSRARFRIENYQGLAASITQITT